MVLLASCAAETVGDHSYYKGKCVDCFNNPITGSPINYRKGEESASASPATEEIATTTRRELLPAPISCGEKVQLKAVGKVDVDTAYVRIKRELGYKTKDEILRERGINPGSDLARRNQWFDSGYRHEVQPGVRYLLSERVGPKASSRQERAWLTLEIEKAGSGSYVYGEYCNGGTDGFSEGGTFPSRLKSELELLLGG